MKTANLDPVQYLNRNRQRLTAGLLDLELDLMSTEISLAKADHKEAFRILGAFLKKSKNRVAEARKTKVATVQHEGAAMFIKSADGKKQIHKKIKDALTDMGTLTSDSIHIQVTITKPALVEAKGR